jgi:putative transposase
MDSAHTWRALLYTELNPVRAKMVGRAVDYPWSSARVHCGQDRCPPWLTLHPWAEAYRAVEWEEILEVGFRDHGQLERLREGLRCGRPVGDDAFIQELEAKLGRPLRLQKTGRPAKDRGGVSPLEVGVESELSEGKSKNDWAAAAP